MEFTDNEKKNKVHIVLVGNPGVGKSTILNSLCGELLFRSGVSYGQGLTTCLQLVDHGDEVFADTPGLADVNLREQAAREIDKLFRTVDRMKLVFVITLESGRIRPADLTTMKLVLDALGVDDLTNRFAIIVNKLSKRMKTDLKDPATRAKLFECLNSGNPDIRRQTQFIEILEARAELDDADNILVEPDPAIVDLIASMSPVQVIAEAVRPIDIADMDAKTEQFEEMMTKIMTANQAQVEAMMKQQAEMQDRLMEITVENNRLELESIRREAAAQAELAEERRKAEMERLRLENAHQNAQLRAEMENKLLQSQLQEQQREATRQAQRAEEARQNAARQEAYLQQQRSNSGSSSRGGRCIIS
jgi:GTP-binding protein EngB required for normal cell division